MGTNLSDLTKKEIVIKNENVKSTVLNIFKGRSNGSKTYGETTYVKLPVERNDQSTTENFKFKAKMVREFSRVLLNSNIENESIEIKDRVKLLLTGKLSSKISLYSKKFLVRHLNYKMFSEKCLLMRQLTS